MICEICNKNKSSRKIKEKVICNSCYKLYFRVRQTCDICGELNYLKTSKPIKICEKCYSTINPGKSFRPSHECSKCGDFLPAAQKINDKYICHKCYEPPKEICPNCGAFEIIQSRKNGQVRCIKCYESPKKICSICGNLRKVHNNIDRKPVCQKCYKAPEVECFNCKSIRKVATYIDGKPHCKSCYDTLVWLKIENNRVKQLIRKRIRDCLCGKIIFDKLIDYNSIISYLGECPGNREDYHIDHIFPLFAFDFNNPVHIRAAFAPENHQWLLKSENLKKYNKYNKEEFKKYLSNFIRNCS